MRDFWGNYNYVLYKGLPIPYMVDLYDALPRDYVYSGFENTPVPECRVNLLKRYHDCPSVHEYLPVDAMLRWIDSKLPVDSDPGRARNEQYRVGTTIRKLACYTDACHHWLNAGVHVQAIFTKDHFSALTRKMDPRKSPEELRLICDQFAEELRVIALQTIPAKQELERKSPEYLELQAKWEARWVQLSIEKNHAVDRLNRAKEACRNLTIIVEHDIQAIDTEIEQLQHSNLPAARVEEDLARLRNDKIHMARFISQLRDVYNGFQ